MKQVDIKDFEEYQITDDCRVWSKKRNKWLKPSTNQGYWFVILCKEGKTYSRLIHRLVAEAFIPNPDNKPCIDHINGNRQDNSIENLRWCTYEENNNNPITKRRMSIGSTGKKHSDATKLKMSERMAGEKNPNFGKSRSDEFKKKMSEKGKQEVLSRKRDNFGRFC